MTEGFTPLEIDLQKSAEILTYGFSVIDEGLANRSASSFAHSSAFSGRLCVIRAHVGGSSFLAATT